MYRCILCLILIFLSFISFDSSVALEDNNSNKSTDLDLFENQLKRTKLNLENATELLKEGIISQKEYKTLEKKYNSARSNLKYVVNTDNFVSLVILEKESSKQDLEKKLHKLKLSHQKMMEFYQQGLIPESDVIEAELNYKATEIKIENLSKSIIISELTNPLDIVVKSNYKVITSKYGYRIHPITGIYTLHSGIDIALPKGFPVYAYQNGIIRKCGEGKLSGKHIIIAHNKEYSSRYLHLSKIAVKQNEKVKKGQLIGYIGSTGRSTGDHLHFEITKNQRAIDINYLINNNFAKK